MDERNNERKALMYEIITPDYVREYATDMATNEGVSVPRNFSPKRIIDAVFARPFTPAKGWSHSGTDRDLDELDYYGERLACEVALSLGLN